MDGNTFSYFKIEILSIYLAKLCMVISRRIIILHDANSHFIIVQFFLIFNAEKSPRYTGGNGARSDSGEDTRWTGGSKRAGAYRPM